MLRAAVALLVVGRFAAGGEPPEPAGLLSCTQSLGGFFQALSRLEEHGGRTTRVLQLGDSHTAADGQTGAARRALQARFGDGGRGFVTLAQPPPGPEGLRLGWTGQWRRLAARLGADGRFGLGGVALESVASGAHAWLESPSPADRIELSFLRQPGGGALELLVDGVSAARVSTEADSPRSGWETVQVRPGPHAVEVRTQGEGPSRIFGVRLERTRGGVVYETAGIAGARAAVSLQWDEGHLAEQLQRLPLDLLVIAYGTNESSDQAPIESYEQQLAKVVGRLTRAAPTASCLVLGPPDRAVFTRDGWVTSPRLVEIVASQKRVARAAGCAFFDQLAAMGGPGTIAVWANERPPRAARDRVHLSKDGYTLLGNSLAAELLRAYELRKGSQREGCE